ALKSIAIEDTILSLGTEISALDTQRHQYASHPSTMERYQGQLQQLGQQALQQLYELDLVQEAAMAAQPHGLALEQALRASLPALPLRKHIEQLLRDQGALAQALESAKTLLGDRKADADAIQARLGAQPVPKVSLALREALERAKTLGDAESATQKAKLQVHDGQTALEQALAGLGQWAMPPEQLAGLALPTAQVLAAWL